MEYYGRHTETARREIGAYDDRKPQLPSFEHFVRETGHPDLTFRGPPKLETTFSPRSGNYAFGLPSLAAPPVANGVHNASVPKSQQEVNYEYQSAILEEHELPQIDPHRRASLALPLTTRCQPRPSRAYSSTNVSAQQRDVLSWQHGRVIHEENIPGKGLCYVYDDGTICPKEVNGDAVNPKWGTTKAGKPRKRLGQACNTCREKKIKCDPGYPKCSQCLRFNRECRFDANSRQGHKSPKFRTSNESPGGPAAHSPKEYITSRKSSTTPTEGSTPTDAAQRTLSRSSNSAEDVLSPTMLEREIHDAPTPSKRQRLDGAERKCDVDHTESSNGDPTLSDARREGFAPEVDPINANEKLTRHYVDTFVDYTNVANFEIFPRRQFVEWVTTNVNKSPEDRIALYGVMAWGTIYSEHRDRLNHRAIFKAVIYQGLDRVEEMPSLQLAHALLYLAFTEFVDGQFLKGYSIFARCIGVLSFLQMNVEPSPDDGSTAYDFLPATYAECRRRTYWAAFCTDTYLSFRRESFRMLHSIDDIFLRLPCAGELYERDEIPPLPVFDPNNVMPRNLTREDHLAMGNMAHTIQITAICSQVKRYICRCQSSFRVRGQCTIDRAERDRLSASLRDWADGYNEAIQAREGRTKDSEHPRRNHGELGGARAKKFAGLDFLFHFAHMELNRRVFHRSLSEGEIVSHTKNAIVHAVETLKLTQQLLEKGGPETRDYTFATKTAVAMYAIYSAIDIITAAGKTADVVDSQSGLMALMYSGLEVLQDLKPRLKGAEVQLLQVKARIQTVFSSARAAVNERKVFFFCPNPVITAADRDFDVIYGTDRLQFLRIAYSSNPNNAVKDGEVYEIHATDKGVGMPGYKSLSLCD